MSKPAIIKTVSGYNLEWQSEQIKIEVSRIRETKVSTTAEILITCTASGLPSPHIKQTTFSLTTNDARPKLAKELTKIYQAEWDIILEQLCVKVLAEIRKGEPVEILGNLEIKAKPPEYLIDPFIIRNQPSVIFGEPGAAKSTFALILASILAIGWHDNPGNIITRNKNYVVLWLDWETDKSTVDWQLACIQRGHGFEETPYQIVYRPCSQPLADDVEQIRQLIDEYHVSIIFIDSLGLACGGDLNSAEPALRFFAAYRQLNTTGLLLAHTARNTESTNKHIFGSMFFEAQARNVWEIVKSQDDEDSIIVGLYHKKPPPFGKLRKPQGFRFQFEDTDLDGVSDSTSFEWHDPNSLDATLERMTTNGMILEELKTGPLTPKELEDRGIKNPRQALHRLKIKGLIVLLDKEKYGLIARKNQENLP